MIDYLITPSNRNFPVRVLVFPEKTERIKFYNNLHNLILDNIIKSVLTKF